jgi:hypothetical protein
MNIKKIGNSSYIELGHKVEFESLNAAERWRIIHDILHRLIYPFSCGEVESICSSRIFGTADGHRLWYGKFDLEDQVVPIQFIDNDLENKRKCRLNVDTPLVPLCIMCTLSMNRGSRLIEKSLLLGKDYPFHFIELRRYIKIQQDDTVGWSCEEVCVKNVTLTHVTEEYIKKMLARDYRIGICIIRAVKHLLEITIEKKNDDLQRHQLSLNHIEDISSRIVGF